MTLSDILKKAGNVVISSAKRNVKDAIANEAARTKAKKIAWKDMGTGTRARNIISYGEFEPAIIWVTDDGVYATDKYISGIVEITGEDAEKFQAESIGAAAITKIPRTGFGSVSPMDAQIPDYLTRAHTTGQDPKQRKKTQTYKEWMGLK